MPQNRSSRHSAPITVKDPRQIARLLIGTIICGSIGAGLMWYAETSPPTPDHRFIYAMATTFLGLALLLYLLLMPQWGGTVISVKEDTIEFPGGGIAANEFSDYINPSWLLQSFRRHTRKLSEIQSLQPQHDIRTRGTDVHHLHSLKLLFDDGAVTVDFGDNFEKREQLMSTLVQVLEMGSPTIVR